jgi:hypothetical protein
MATLIEKSEYCDIQAKGFRRDNDFAKNLMKQLDDLFDTSSDGILRVSLSSSVGLVVGIPVVLFLSCLLTSGGAQRAIAAIT